MFGCNAPFPSKLQVIAILTQIHAGEEGQWSGQPLIFYIHTIITMFKSTINRICLDPSVSPTESHATHPSPRRGGWSGRHWWYPQPTAATRSSGIWNPGNRKSAGCWLCACGSLMPPRCTGPCWTGPWSGWWLSTGTGSSPGCRRKGRTPWGSRGWKCRWPCLPAGCTGRRRNRPAAKKLICGRGIWKEYFNSNLITMNCCIGKLLIVLIVRYWILACHWFHCHCHHSQRLKFMLKR